MARSFVTFLFAVVVSAPQAPKAWLRGMTVPLSAEGERNCPGHGSGGPKVTFGVLLGMSCALQIKAILEILRIIKWSA